MTLATNIRRLHHLYQTLPNSLNLVYGYAWDWSIHDKIKKASTIYLSQLSNLERIPVSTGSVSDIKEFQEAVKFRNSLETFPSLIIDKTRNQLDRQILAHRYRFGELKQGEIDLKEKDALSFLAKEWKEKNATYSNKELTDEEIEKIVEVCTYREFMSLLMCDGNLREQFFYWILPNDAAHLPFHANDVEIFIKFPGLYNTILRRLCFLISRLGNLFVINQNNQTLTVPIEGERVEILNGKKEYTLRGRFRKGELTLTIDEIFKEMENMDEEDGFDTEEEEQEEGVMYEISLEEDEDSEEDKDSEEEGELEEEMEYESDEEGYANESYSPKKGMKKVKPKGVGLGSGPKFAYNKTSGGFKEDKKEGPKEMGTGKAKFDYKKGANMEGKSKVVKAETKEGDYGMNRGDKSKTMKGKEDYTTKKGMTNSKGEKAFEKEETKEAARTYGMGSKEGRGLRKGITNNRNYVYKNGVTVESLDAEVNMLREKNEEYRKALNVFREKLNEVAIFNSNLAYATRLFTEHSTTKKEKINILRRFDDVETLKESKSLYRSIKDELGTTDTKSINESVGNKLNKTVTTGSSTTLIESKTYENPQFLRMKDLMGKLG